MLDMRSQGITDVLNTVDTLAKDVAAAVNAKHVLGFDRNGAAGQKLDGSAIGNQDNVDSGWSRRADARYDGGGNNTATNTLADVAMYYYKTDLRGDLTDQVPTTRIRHRTST